jgi:copper transporter 1
MSSGIEPKLNPARKEPADESSSLLGPGRDAGRQTEQKMKIVKAALYAVQVFYSFFIM